MVRGKSPGTAVPAALRTGTRACTSPFFFRLKSICGHQRLCVLGHWLQLLHLDQHVPVIFFPPKMKPWVTSRMARPPPSVTQSLTAHKVLALPTEIGQEPAAEIFPPLLAWQHLQPTRCQGGDPTSHVNYIPINFPSLPPISLHHLEN